MYSAVHDILVDGRELRVYSNGTRHPVLFLHDLGASAAAFEPLTGPIVAGGHELVAIDLPGCGHSDPLPGSELGEYVDLLSGALAVLGQEAIDVVGHGFGGYLAAGIAARRPGAIGHLVLCEPSVPPRSGPPARARMSAAMAVGGAVTTLRRGRLRQNIHGYSRARAVLEQLAQADPQWWQAVSSIDTPTLVLGTSAGEPAERAALDQLAAAIPGALRNTVAGGRRPFQTHAADFAGHVLDFLAA